MTEPVRPADLARELVVDVREIEAALAAQGYEHVGSLDLVPDDVAEQIRIVFGGAVSRDTRASALNERDAQYRRALGIGPGDPLPKALGTIAGNGKRSKPRGSVAEANRRAADQMGGSQLSRQEFNGSTGDNESSN